MVALRADVGWFRLTDNGLRSWDRERVRVCYHTIRRAVGACLVAVALPSVPALHVSFNCLPAAYAVPHTAAARRLDASSVFRCCATCRARCGGSMTFAPTTYRSCAACAPYATITA